MPHNKTKSNNNGFKFGDRVRFKQFRHHTSRVPQGVDYENVFKIIKISHDGRISLSPVGIKSDIGVAWDSMHRIPQKQLEKVITEDYYEIY